MSEAQPKAHSKSQPKSQLKTQPISQTIIGIDPGSYNTGYGLVRVVDGDVRHLEHGVLKAPKTMDFPKRLQLLGDALHEVFLRSRPDIAVIERIFLGKNADSAFKLGHIRGICVLTAVKSGSEVIEYAARSIKKGVTGNGASSKEQVQMILFATLGIRGNVQLDASDALAMAFYHASRLDVLKRLREQTY